MAHGGVHIPALPLPQDAYDTTTMEQTNQAIELALTELAASLADVEELSEGNLEELIDGLGEQTPLADTDKIIVRTATGIEYVQAGNIGGGGGIWVPPRSGRWKACGIPHGYSTGTSNVQMIADRAYATPFVPATDVTITDLACVETSGATGSVAMGLYDSTVQGEPGTLLASTGQQTVVTGGNAFSITNTALKAGVLYYLVVAVTSAIPFFKALGSAGAVNPLNSGHGQTSLTNSEDMVMYDAIASWSDLPSTWVFTAYGGGGQPAVVFGKVL